MTIQSNGVLVTKTLLFVNEALPRRAGSRATNGVLRAFDKATGREIWRRDVATAPNGAPITYEIRGKQYIAFTTRTHTDLGRARELIVYGLP